MTRATLVLALSLPLCGAGALRAQSASDLLGAGVRAYQALDYDAAAALLARSLGRDLAAGLADSRRARALTYLAATGGEAGVVYRPPQRPFSLRLAYRMDDAAVRGGGSASETLEAISLAIIVGGR